MQETVPSKRFRLVEREHFGIDLEYNTDFAILHIPWATKFDKGVYLQMLYGFDGLKEFIKDMGYHTIHLGIEPDKEFPNKLAKKFGFKFLAENQGFNIYEMELV